MFFGKDGELDPLNSLWRKRVSPLVACRGRRRIGKSALIWEGIAVPFIKKYPDDPLDGEKMHDEIVAARKAGLA